MSAERPLIRLHNAELWEMFEAAPSMSKSEAVPMLFTMEHELRPRRRKAARELLPLVVALREKLWPKTVPPVGGGSISADGWYRYSVLYVVGYSVRAGGPSLTARRAILAGVVTGALPRCHGPDYMAKWGGPNTLQRLLQTANNIATYCRLAKLKDADQSVAIAKWEADLAWLKATYYTVEFARQGAWPSTEP